MTSVVLHLIWGDATMLFNETEVRAVLQFFNIPNASLDDAGFLHHMGFGANRGLDAGKKLAADAKWGCREAIEAVERFAMGFPRSQKLITSGVRHSPETNGGGHGHDGNAAS